MAGHLRAHRALSASRKAETAYVLALRGILGAVHKGVLQVVHREHLGRPLESDLRQDEDPPIGLGDDLLRRMLRFTRPKVLRAFDGMAADVDRGSAEGSRVVGIRPRSVPGLAKVIANARTRNVELITNATADFLDDVRETLDDLEGYAPDAIAKALEDRAGVSTSRAILIARDQTTKLNAAVNRERQTAAGVTRYRWSTSLDERVRASHAALEGQAFDWDDPPEVDGEPAHPGEPIQCRCIALPLIEELEEPAEETLEEPEAEEPEESDLGQAAE